MLAGTPSHCGGCHCDGDGGKSGSGAVVGAAAGAVAARAAAAFFFATCSLRFFVRL